MSRPLRILIVDDSEDDAQLILRHLAKASLEVETTRLCYLAEIEAGVQAGCPWDLIICDHCLPDADSGDVLNVLKENGCGDIPFILVSGLVDIETAVATMRLGANDFIFKDDLSRLVPAIRRELKEAEMRIDKAAAENALAESNQKLKNALKTLANTQDQMVATERFRALGQMSSGIAHDFNNALMKMQGTAELMKDYLPAENNLYSQLNVQIGDAASVVRRLCDFYRQSPATEETAVDLSKILSDALEFTRPKWQHGEGGDQKNIEVEIHSHARHQAWGGASQFREILTNLIFNACDALAETGGKIELISRDVDGDVEVEVKDNGCGMSKELLSRCLEPLYSTKGENGTGLGLAIVNSTIQSYGGSLRVESAVGKGTSIILTLRAANIVKPTAAKPNSAETESRKKLKILAIDDEAVIGTMLERYLVMLGHDAESVTDPLEAAKMFESTNYDVVLSDRSMPQMSGDELAVRLREVSPSTRFVMVSGYGDLMLINGELPEGVDLVVPKPISGEMLRDALDSLFDSGGDTSVALAG